MNELLLKTAVSEEARLYFLTSWLFYSRKMQGKGRAYFNASDVQEWLKNKLSASLIDELVSIQHLEKECPVPFRILLTVKYFSALTIFKQEAYLQFVKNVRSVPIDPDAVWFSSRFFSLYADVPDNEAERFLKQAVWMAYEYCYSQYPQYREDYVLSELQEIFRIITQLKSILPSVKARFLSSATARNLMWDFRDTFSAAALKEHELGALPGKKFSIEELFGFINSDNFSIFGMMAFLLPLCMEQMSMKQLSEMAELFLK